MLNLLQKLCNFVLLLKRLGVRWCQFAMHFAENRPDSARAAGKISRRWSVRQKIYSPAYVSVNPCEDGSIFGLNQVFDIGTDGLSFQNPVQMEPGSRVRMSLELSGADTPLRANGRVVWSDPSGRTGVEFRKSSLSAPRHLEEYLFLNAITACAHYDALRSGGVSAGEQTQATVEAIVPPCADAEPAHAPNYAEVLELLAQIKTSIEAQGPDDEKLQGIAEQTKAFLDCEGVAIALAGENKVVCRASSGNAPGVGAEIKAGVGFAGECLRQGVLMSCEDADADLRVDRSLCQSLGIRSIVAVPIKDNEGVVGIIAAFSGRPRGFSRNSRLFVQRLAEFLIPSEHETTQSAFPPAGDSISASGLVLQANELIHPELGEDSEERFAFAGMRRILVLTGAAAILLAVALFLPVMRTRAGSTRKSVSPDRQSSIHGAALKGSSPYTSTSELDQLRELADSGDPDAQFALGARYATGDEVQQNYPTAVHWFSLAANQGQVVAQATLGAYYWAGRGVPVDLHKAYFWSVLAQANGDESSKYRLISLASRMSHGEVVQIQEDANEWLKQHQLNSTADARP